MFRSKAPAVLLRSNYLKRFVVPKHGKDDVTDFMHDGSHSHSFFLARAFPDVIVINHRVHGHAASFINLYVIECGHVKDTPGKTGTTLGHMDFVAIELSRLFHSWVKPKVSIKLLGGRKKF